MRDCHSSDDKDVIAIDGKTLRHSYDKSRRKGAIYVIKIRLHIICDVPDELIDFTFEWKELKKLCMAVSFRSIITEQKKEPEMTDRYYSISADLTAEKFATANRNHWYVENKLHWHLDVVMNKDDCKIRRGNAAELFAQADIDGGLVGGASLKADFGKIVNYKQAGRVQYHKPRW